jgi:predicted transcriptional regulator
MITIETYNLKKIEEIVIKACLAKYPKRDIGEIAKTLNIGRTTLYEKLLKMGLKREKILYKKFSKRRIGRPSKDIHIIKAIAKKFAKEESIVDISKKEKEFQKKNKAYLKKKNALIKKMQENDGWIGTVAIERKAPIHFPIQLWQGD